MVGTAELVVLALVGVLGGVVGGMGGPGGIPVVLAQVLGWTYVHSVSERAVAYTLAGVAVAGVGAIVVW